MVKTRDNRKQELGGHPSCSIRIDSSSESPSHSESSSGNDPRSRSTDPSPILPIAVDLSGAIPPPIAPDMLPGSEILRDPMEAKESRMTLKRLQTLTAKHNIPFDDVLVPTGTARPHIPPDDHMAISVPMCNVGAIPPFPLPIIEFLRRMNLAPMQLSPIAYGLLLSICYLYTRYLKYPPTFNDIAFLFNFRHNETQSPSTLYLEAVRGWKIIEEVPTKVGETKRDWFWIKRQPGCAQYWLQCGKFRLPFKTYSFYARISCYDHFFVMYFV